MRKTEWSLSGYLRELKNKRKVQLGNRKSGCGRISNGVSQMWS